MSDQPGDSPQPKQAADSTVGTTSAPLNYERKPWSFRDPRWVTAGNVLIIVVGIAFLICISMGVFW